jgi:hypothetical protein
VGLHVRADGSGRGMVQDLLTRSRQRARRRRDRGAETFLDGAAAGVRQDQAGQGWTEGGMARAPSAAPAMVAGDSIRSGGRRPTS